MQFNPLFIKKIETEDSISLTKNKKVDNSNYLFSDIINVYIADEETPDSDQSLKVIEPGNAAIKEEATSSTVVENISDTEAINHALPTVLLPLFQLTPATEEGIDTGETLISVSGISKTSLTAMLTILLGKENQIENAGNQINFVSENKNGNLQTIVSESGKKEISGFSKIINEIKLITGNGSNNTVKLKLNENNNSGLYDLHLMKSVLETERISVKGNEVKQHQAIPLEKDSTETGVQLSTSELKNVFFSKGIAFGDEQTEQIVRKLLDGINGNEKYTSVLQTKTSVPKVNEQLNKNTVIQAEQQYQPADQDNFTATKSLTELTNLTAKSTVKVKSEHPQDKKPEIKITLNDKSEVRVVQKDFDKQKENYPQKETPIEKATFVSIKDESVKIPHEQQFFVPKSNEQVKSAEVKESAAGLASQSAQAIVESPALINSSGSELKKIFLPGTETLQPEKVIKVGNLINELEQFLAQKDKENITIKLSPEHLGKVKIVLRTFEQYCTAKIEVETETAKKIVEQNISQLYRGLQQQGVQMQSIQVFICSEQKQPKYAYGKKKFQSEKSIPDGDTKEVIQGKRFGYNTYEYLA